MALDRQGVIRFFRYAIVGVSTLLFDLALLAILTTYAHVPYYVATPIAFLIAVSINYLVSRRAVFHGTERALHTGYAYFALTAGLGAIVITSLVAALVQYAHIEFFIARIAVAGVVGIGNYLFNLHINFKVAGKHHSMR